MNPIQSQAVIYIVQRMSSLACLFYLVAMWSYVRGRLAPPERRWRWFVATGSAFALAAGSKENCADAAGGARSGGGDVLPGPGHGVRAAAPEAAGRWLDRPAAGGRRMAVEHRTTGGLPGLQQPSVYADRAAADPTANSSFLPQPDCLPGPQSAVDRARCRNLPVAHRSVDNPAVHHL